MHSIFQVFLGSGGNEHSLDSGLKNPDIFLLDTWA